MNNQFDHLILKYSKLYNVPFSIIKAIIEKESNFNIEAKGDPCGKTKGTRKFKCPDNKHCSFGLGQANWCSGTAQSFFNVKNYKELFDPETSIRGIANYLSYQFNRYNNWLKAISGYNAGSYTKNNSHYVSDVWRLVTKYSLQGYEKEKKSNPNIPKNTGLIDQWFPYILIGLGIIIIIYTFKKFN